MKQIEIIKAINALSKVVKVNQDLMMGGSRKTAVIANEKIEELIPKLNIDEN